MHAEDTLLTVSENDRSTALQVIDELQKLQERHRRMGELVAQLERLCAELRSAVAGQSPPPSVT